MLNTLSRLATHKAVLTIVAIISCSQIQSMQDRVHQAKIEKTLQKQVARIKKRLTALPRDISPLHVAAGLGYELAAHHFINNCGIDVNTVDAGGITPLITAARHGHAEMIPLLVEHGADINASDCCYETALMAAATRGHFLVMCALVDAKADLTLRDADGKTACNLAYDNKKFEIADFLKNEMAKLPLRPKINRSRPPRQMPRLLEREAGNGIPQKLILPPIIKGLKKRA